MRQQHQEVKPPAQHLGDRGCWAGPGPLSSQEEGETFRPRGEPGLLCPGGN